MKDKIIRQIEKRVCEMSFADAITGYEAHEFAIRHSASVIVQSRIDLDHLCSLNVARLTPSMFARYSRLKRELIRNLRPDEEDLPFVN